MVLAVRGYAFGKPHNGVKSDCMQLYTSSGDEQKPTEVGASQLKSSLRHCHQRRVDGRFIHECVYEQCSYPFEVYVQLINSQ